MITIDEARGYYQDSETAHDFNHVLRVLTLAEKLARVEGADLEIVRAAALLHDISRSDEDDRASGDHAELAAERARSLLLARGIESARADAVAHAIAAHRFRSRVAPQTIEAKILFDADKLDSIGAIGVARAFAIAGSLNQPLWSDVVKDAVATRDQHNSNHSPVAEFVVKLSRVRERLHTAAARKIADERHAFMAAFFDQLERDVRGDI